MAARQRGPCRMAGRLEARQQADEVVVARRRQSGPEADQVDGIGQGQRPRRRLEERLPAARRGCVRRAATGPPLVDRRSASARSRRQAPEPRQACAPARSSARGRSSRRGRLPVAPSRAGPATRRVPRRPGSRRRPVRRSSLGATVRSACRSGSTGLADRSPRRRGCRRACHRRRRSPRRGGHPIGRDRHRRPHGGRSGSGQRASRRDERRPVSGGSRAGRRRHAAGRCSGDGNGTARS